MPEYTQSLPVPRSGLAAGETSLLMIRPILGVVALAASAIAASSSITVPYVITIPYATALATSHHINAVGTKDPIRTVVTVNSNIIDVLAAEENHVPKVLEKLRELCAGSYATMYPEICDHLNDKGYWPLTETTVEALPTTITIAIIHSTTVISSIYIPTTVTASWMAAPRETAPSTFASAVRPSSSSSSSSSSVQSSSFLLPSSSITPSLPSMTMRPQAVSPEKEQEVWDSEQIYEDAPDEENYEPEPDVETEPEPEPEPDLEPDLEPEPELEVEVEAVEAVEAENKHELEPESSELEPQLEFGDNSSPDPDRPDQDPDPEPEFIPEVIIPSPTHPRQFKNPQAYPSISYFRSATDARGCTQTVSNFKKVTDFYTSTVYAETVTTTRKFACGDCPNIIIVQVGGPGILLEPKTTELVQHGTGTVTVWGCRESASA
ncbi:hypothetical protein QBC43DRAFT_290043 [Cladorrhinum sp. PSN259]|nr:hypothetical protein QBC43DRAFT_290043 [Cladorrhinum sp. PSN259]